MTERSQPSHPEQCATAVREARNALARWEREAEEAQQTLDELRSSMGAQVLDNPERAAELTSSMQQLRDRIALAESAAAAARPRVVETERAYLAAEADRLEQSELAPVLSELRAHDQRTRELLQELAEHEGPYVPESEVAAAQYTGVGTLHLPAPKSGQLRWTATLLERQVQVLREVAAGRDPQPHMNEWNALGNLVDYPACISAPDAVVPWRQHLAARAELEALIGA
jgi:hypothetical protein